MRIKPLGGIIQLLIDEAKAGVLDTSSRNSAIEVAEVLEVGEGIQSLEKGDKVFVKAWAVDIITHEDIKYYFVDIESKGILAIIDNLLGSKVKNFEDYVPAEKFFKDTKVN